MEKRKVSIISFLGITAFWLLFSLLFAWIGGDIKANFLNAATRIFVFFVAPVFITPVIYFALKLKAPYIFTLFFYYGGLAIIAFTHKFLRTVESADQVVICFVISFVVCYVANKIIELKKRVAELTAYKKTAEPYMDFFEKKANACGMGMYEYLEAIKEHKKE